MTKTELLRRKLQQLDEYLGFLEQIKEKPKELFLNEPQMWASTERFLQMALEVINDMGSHVIADENLGTVEQYRDIPKIFAEQNWIDVDIKRLWIKMIGFRNLLVHGYATVDRSEVYSILQNNLDDIKKIKKVFLRFL
ncbi:MAG TPA: DUF86 domain-containing protein [Balneolaceae bacterium]|nr:DUF86 domain-containing protein [Balneolaceae bacterium]